MSARSGRWELLDRCVDPVPGDPDEVRRLADGFESTAEEVGDLTRTLRRLSELDGWQGQAAETFAEKAEDLADDLGGAERRYRELAAAVRGWVAPLTAARAESAGALADAVAAEEDRRRCADDVLAGVGDPTPAQVAAQDQREADHAAALARLQAAGRRLEEALTALEEAGDRTAAAIRAASEHGADHAWDDLKGAVRGAADLLDAVATVLGYVAMALAAVTLVVVLVATAPAWLVALGLVASVALLGLHVALAVSESGAATWTDVGLDLLGIATAGLGGALARGVGAALPALRGSVAQAVGRNARASRQAVEEGMADHVRAGSASAIQDPGNPLRVWGEQYLDAAAARVAAEGAEATARVQAGAVTDVPWGQRLGMLDRGLAQDLLELQRLAAEATAVGSPLADDALRLAEGARVAGALQSASTSVAVLDGADQLAGDLGGPDGLVWKADFHQAQQNQLWRVTGE
ncbi:hypothetical protein [Blastococcus sp. TF02A-35]|uniref:hypothetical protein n=1 Tax=Blastococcus sp. TF02A-35 TaxID=2559612 RepID=UPI0010742FC3|nr:hypothetical protein [Blastococcus sp. TF02A_35]TFV44639.1 hypothetical protein E4P43_18545 [Blastococcus sp. TF02A_35]